LIFGTQLDLHKTERQKQKKSLKGAWPRSRDPYKFWYTAKNISKMRRARDLKFGTQTHRDNISKTGKEKFRKGAWPRSRDPYKFWHTPKISPMRIELET